MLYTITVMLLMVANLKFVKGSFAGITVCDETSDNIAPLRTLHSINRPNRRMRKDSKHPHARDRTEIDFLGKQLAKKAKADEKARKKREKAEKKKAKAEEKARKKKEKKARKEERRMRRTFGGFRKKGQNNTKRFIIERKETFENVREELEKHDGTFKAYFDRIDKELREDIENARLDVVAALCLANRLSKDAGMSKAFTFVQDVGDDLVEELKDVDLENSADQRTERRRLPETSGGYSSSAMPEWMETILCTSSSTSMCGSSSYVDVNILDDFGFPSLDDNEDYITKRVLRSAIEVKTRTFKIRHNTAAGKKTNKAGFKTMWKYAKTYMAKNGIKKPEYDENTLREITGKMAGYIIKLLYEQKVELSQLEQVRHSLSYAYFLREGKSKGNFPEVNAKWKTFDLSELPAGDLSDLPASADMGRRRLAQKTPTYGSERYNRLVQRLQDRHLADM